MSDDRQAATKIAQEMNATVEANLDYIEQMLSASIKSASIVLGNPWVLDNAAHQATNYTGVLLARINRVLIGMVESHGIHEAAENREKETT